MNELDKTLEKNISNLALLLSKDGKVAKQRKALDEMFILINKLQKSKEIKYTYFFAETSEVSAIVENGEKIEISKLDLMDYVLDKHKIDLRFINEHFEIDLESWVISWEEILTDYYITKLSV